MFFNARPNLTFELIQRSVEIATRSSRQPQLREERLNTLRLPPNRAENIRVAGGHTIVENMRHGMSPTDACLEAMKRVARNYNNDKSKLAKFDLNFYALRMDGAHGAAALWSGKRHGAKYAVNDGGESRLEDCAYLFQS